ncbi:Phosphoribosylamine--glycine ligase [Pontiella desulfatans]|uniref:Phosphoribosylamine--glycine ligase n=1 Tax=Pontiella desulfatans TaxID=2750659 RepID=A0A6C2TVJ3_PONDE|nr:phosphoribosylamine--glycine ligase [Pontiella desulfatans]VGO11603.1 Phosphoribosylamine--glycine ligase [Pontiella desulfatans]
MKILVVGNGGREHTLAWKLANDSAKPEIFCTPGNAGTAGLGTNLGFGATDLDGIQGWCAENKPDLVVIGPEAPLCAGLTDVLEADGIRVFGPSKAAAEMEGSKQFAKEIMKAGGVPTSAYETFTDPDEACVYVRERGAPIVIKADGLAAGKGVTVAETVEQAEAAIRDALEGNAFGDAGSRVVIEDFLVGEEASILALIDGENVVMLASSQDHKRIFEKDEGPNTGGMGAYSPASIVNETVLKKVKEEVYDRTLAELKKRGITYKGVLYAGLMIENDQPSVVEFNCRFGDPETQCVLARWDGDMLPAINGVIDGNLSEEMIRWKDEHSVCVVMVAGGYPGDYAKGEEIENLGKANAVDDTVVFHAGTALDGDKVVTAGGRVLGITSLGKDLPDALSKAYIAVETISFKDAFYRNDIAHRELKRLGIDLNNE